MFGEPPEIGSSADITKSSSTFDATKPRSARVWNYWLGGKDNFPADRKFGDDIFEVYPEIIDKARACRAFLVRVVRYLVMEANIRQFLDIGTGLPIMNNTHEVAQRLARDARIVYVDNDPMVLVHARALLVSTQEGATDYVDADARVPGQILAAAAATLDFTRPIALLLLGIMGNIADTDEAYSIVRHLMKALPPGSYLVISDGTITDENVRALIHGPAGYGYQNRTPEQIAHFFDGLELVEPGVISTPLWRPDPGEAPLALDEFCGVGRKR
jgi:S-adenosyl methyltransferase